MKPGIASVNFKKILFPFNSLSDSLLSNIREIVSAFYSVFCRRDSNPQPSDRQHVTAELQSLVNTEVTRIAQSDLADNLAEICGQFPDLEVVIKTWRFLPEELRKAIIKMIS